ncbi:MFS transporter [Reichenbachiella sp.]|uniref:MFS transporter n=1 Tax=Reichenbachiella sp. TaxID=2184521 RepID=UPI0032987C81
MNELEKNGQYVKFCAYGFLKSLRFYDAFLLLFFLDQGISFSQMGVLYATREIAVNLCEVPSGIVADTYGRKHALLASFFFYILSFVIFYLSNDFKILFLAMAVYGLADAFRSGTHKGMIMDYLKLNDWEDQKVMYYGHTRSWSQKGAAISALFAGGLVMYAGSYRSVYLFSIVPYLLNFINIMTYPEVLNHSLSKKDRNATKNLFTYAINLFRAVKNRKVFQVINSSAIHTAYLKVIKDYIQPVMLQLAILLPILETMELKKKSGLLIGILYFFIFLMTSYASKMSFKLKRLGTERIPWVTLQVGLVCGALSGVFIYNEWWMLSLLSFILVFVVENLRKPNMTAILSDNVPNKILTSVLSAQSFYRTIVTSILAILFGFLADLFSIGASLLIISTSIFLFYHLIGGMKLKKL